MTNLDVWEVSQLRRRRCQASPEDLGCKGGEGGSVSSVLRPSGSTLGSRSQQVNPCHDSSCRSGPVLICNSSGGLSSCSAHSSWPGREMRKKN
ncbi:unnamed protein product [Tenebrio molitor]|nr:unnamed protein product [Tenebrio molitor]